MGMDGGKWKVDDAEPRDLVEFGITPPRPLDPQPSVWPRLTLLL